ncbi:PIN domain-like protein [Pisolithus albus]|nr:PIN domain-like protein [Pisolithus albus]
MDDCWQYQSFFALGLGFSVLHHPASESMLTSPNTFVGQSILASSTSILMLTVSSAAQNWQVVNTIFVSWALPHICLSPASMTFNSVPSLASQPRHSRAMGGRELWPILAPAARRSSLGELAVKNFDASGSEEGCHLLTVGFNASAWMYTLVNVFSWRQAGMGQSHEMKIIFHRLSAISQIPLHAYFVFDRPDRPQLKRGKNITALSAPCLLAQRFQELLIVFGFNWHMAPGEAEAELAYLQSLGLIDAVATPYNDALLFGVTCVIRSIPHIGRYEDVYVYTPESIEKCTSLEWGDFLLVRLMCSTEDDDGHCWCSVEVAHRLAYYGFCNAYNPKTILGYSLTDRE